MWDFVKYKCTKQFSLQRERVRQQSNLTQRPERGQRLNHAKNKMVGLFSSGFYWSEEQEAAYEEKELLLSDVYLMQCGLPHTAPTKSWVSPTAQAFSILNPFKQSTSWGLLTHTRTYSHTPDRE